MNARTLPAIAALTLAGCHMDALGDATRVTEDFHRSHPLPAGGRFSIDNFNGSIEIYGWDKNEVEINGTKYASSRDALDEIRIEVTAKPDSVEVRTVRPPMSGIRRGNSGAKYRIHLPSRIQFAQVTSTNGPVRVESVEGTGAVRTSNGAVRIMKYKGNVRVNTSNGPVELAGYSGEADIETSNGPVKIEDAVASLDVRTSNGAITAKLGGASARGAKLRSSNGPVTLSVDAPLNGEILAHTTNSGITLKLAPSVNARLRAHTSNSAVTTDFDLSGASFRKKSEVEGTIGSGGPLIDLSTSNGPIRIQRN